MQPYDYSACSREEWDSKKKMKSNTLIIGGNGYSRGTEHHNNGLGLTREDLIKTWQDAIAKSENISEIIREML